MVAYGENNEAIEMDPDPEHHSVIAPPSYQSESILYAPSEPDGTMRMSAPIDRAPRYIYRFILNHSQQLVSSKRGSVISPNLTLTLFTLAHFCSAMWAWRGTCSNY